MDTNFMEIKEIFQKRIKNIRRRLRINQKELAEMMQVSERTIQYYEKGERIPELVTLYRFCKDHHISIDYLLGLTDIAFINEKEHSAFLYKPDPLEEALKDLDFDKFV